MQKQLRHLGKTTSRGIQGLAVVTASLLVGAVAAAPASAVWTAPVDLATTGELTSVDLQAAQVAIDAEGDAVFVWYRSDGLDVGRIKTRTRSADGTLSAIQTLSGVSQQVGSPQVAVDADGDAVFAWYRYDGANYRIQARARSADGILSAVQTLSPAGQSAFEPQVAVDADGDAVFAWSRPDGADYRVQARTRSADGTLSEVKTLSGAGHPADSPEVAINPDGQAVFAWNRHDGSFWRIQARARSADGTWSAVQTLSPTGTNCFESRVGVDAGGDAAITWFCNDGASLRVQARRRSADGTLSAVKSFSPAGQDASSPEVAVDPDGDAVFTWNRTDGANLRIRAREWAADGTLSAPQALSPAGEHAFSPQVAVDADGNAVFTWMRQDPFSRIQTRTRSADGTLSPVKTLSAAGQFSNVPQVAVDPDGDAAVVWNNFRAEGGFVQAAFGP